MTTANSKLQDKLSAHEGANFLIHTYLHTDKYLHGKLGKRGAAQTIKAPTNILCDVQAELTWQKAKISTAKKVEEMS